MAFLRPLAAWFGNMRSASQLGRAIKLVRQGRLTESKPLLERLIGATELRGQGELGPARFSVRLVASRMLSEVAAGLGDRAAAIAAIRTALPLWREVQSTLHAETSRQDMREWEEWAQRYIEIPEGAPSQQRPPDAFVRVRLFGPEAGGRKSGVGPGPFTCPVFFGRQRNQANDCRFHFDEVQVELQPGGVADGVPVRFVCPDLVLHHLRPGATFTLWDGKDIGEAVVGELPAK